MGMIEEVENYVLTHGTPSGHFVRAVLRDAEKFNYSTGQALFNRLGPKATRVVRGTPFDPFYKNWTAWVIYEWVQNHIIFGDDGEIAAIFNNDQILWEKE